MILGAGPTGICTLLCVMLKHPKQIIVCEKDPDRLDFVRKQYPDVIAAAPDSLESTIRENCRNGGADVVLEVAGAKDTFRMAWQYARPNAVVTVVALYEEDRGSGRLRLPGDSRADRRRED